MYAYPTPNAQMLCTPMSISAELKAKNVMATVPVDSPESIQSEIALQDDIIVFLSRAVPAVLLSPYSQQVGQSALLPIFIPAYGWR